MEAEVRIARVYKVNRSNSEVYQSGDYDEKDSTAKLKSTAFASGAIFRRQGLLTCSRVAMRILP